MSDVILAASAADIEALLPLMQAYWRHEKIAGFDAPRLRAQLQVFLANPGFGRAWLAHRSGACIGYLLCAFTYSFEHGGVLAEVDELFVSAAARGQSVGVALLAAAAAALRLEGCVGFELQVADDNQAAQRFYRRAGFTPRSGYALWINAFN